MKLSIIIPVYNTEKFISQCLNSVLDQTHNDLEIIIINDGSTDQSLQIIKQYVQNDTRIILVDQHNQGLSAARNVGIDIASSEYIMFLDSDDYISLECCANINKEVEQKEYDILIFGRKRFWDDKKMMIYDKIYIDSCYYKSGKDYLMVHMPNDTFIASACNKVFRKSLLKKKSIIFERGIIYEDLLFVIKSLLCANRVKLIEEPFYFYRQARLGSIVTTIKDKDKDVLLTIEFLEKFMERHSPELLNTREFNILIYRWICSAVLFKYPCKAPFSKEANQIVKYIMQDVRFNKYMQFIAFKKGINLKWKISAWLALYSYPIYVMLIYALYNIKKIIRQIPH